MDNKIEPVDLAGKVKVNKDGEGKKFLKLFFTGSFLDAVKYGFTNVIVPYTKDLICKASTNVINYWVNGDKPSNQQSGPNRISYWGGVNNSRQVNPPAVKASTPNSYSVGRLEFDERGDAEAVLLRLQESLAIYKSVSVADLYELSGAKFSYVDYDYGWRNLDTAYVGRTNSGTYVIELPKVVPLK